MDQVGVTCRHEGDVSPRGGRCTARHGGLLVLVFALAGLIGVIQLFVVGSVYGFKDDAGPYVDAAGLQGASGSKLDLVGVPGETVDFAVLRQLAGRPLRDPRGHHPDL